MQDSQIRRRITTKGNDDQVMTNTVTYQPCRPWPSRDIAHGMSPGQRLPQFAQVLMAPQTVDVDIANCMFTVIPQLLRSLQISPEMTRVFKPELDLLEELRTKREDLCGDILKLSVSQGKKILNLVAMGGAVPKQRFDNNPAAAQLLDNVAKAGRFVRWVACSCMPQELKVLTSDQKVDWPAASCAAHFWQGAEAALMRRFLDFARQKPLNHLSLQFDGARIDKSRVLAENDETTEGSYDPFLAAAGSYVAANPAGVTVEFKVKEHLGFIQLLSRVSASSRVPKARRLSLEPSRPAPGVLGAPWLSRR